MKYLKMLGLAAVAAMALMAFTAGSASATTLEVGGTAQSTSVSLTATLKSGSSAILKDTFGFSSNTCTSSEVKGASASPFSNETVTGAVSTLSFSSCAREPVVTHNAGTLHVKWTSGTDGTVTSSGAEVTTGSPFGTLNCKTGAGTHLGTLTGVASGNATMDINAALSCSGISSKWEATYVVTSPSGLGVVS
jgi:hypothetical protein